MKTGIKRVSARHQCPICKREAVTSHHYKPNHGFYFNQFAIKVEGMGYRCSADGAHYGFTLSPRDAIIHAVLEHGAAPGLAPAEPEETTPATQATQNILATEILRLTVENEGLKKDLAAAEELIDELQKKASQPPDEPPSQDYKDVIASMQLS